VVGYYSLSTASVEYDQAPVRAKKGMARHPIPVILIARLAVDHRGREKVSARRSCWTRCGECSWPPISWGIRAILVHAKDEAAKRLYEHFDFDPSPVDPMRLLLIIKDVARLAKGP
jgi:hypothetical protein